MMHSALPDSTRRPHRHGDPVRPASRSLRGQALAGALLAVLLHGCGARSGPEPLQVLERQCLALTGAEDLGIAVEAPAAGLLRVLAEPRGLALAITAEGPVTGAAALSPAERVGPVALVRDVQPGETVRVRIASRESPDLAGEACVSAQLIAPRGGLLARAERAYGEAGEAVGARHWSRAFALYRDAARGFDALGLRQRAAATRHAMAELAYLRLRRERDARLLAAEALRLYGRDAPPATQAALLVLRAKALLELPGDPEAIREEVGALLEAAHLVSSRSRFAAREHPRLLTLEGYAAYAAGDQAAAAERFAAAAAGCAAQKDWACHAQARQNLAVLAEQNRDYATALGAYAAALRVIDPGRNPEHAADILDNLGRLESTVGLFRRSERSRAAAVELYRALGDCDGTRRSLARLGTLLVQAGSIADALVQLHRAVSASCAELLAGAAGPALPRGSTARPIRPVVLRDAEPPGASATFACHAPPDAVRLSADGRQALFLALLALGQGHLASGSTERARECLQLAERFAATARNGVRLFVALGTVYLEDGQPGAAVEALVRAQRAADRAELPPTQVQRGLVSLGLARAAIAGGDGAGARSHAVAALRSAGFRADVGQLVAALELLAESLLATAELDAAAQVLGTAASLTERVPIADLDGERRATYLASQHAVHAALTELAARRALSAAQGEGVTDPSLAWQAFAAAERGRSRSLRHALGQTLGDDATPPLPASSAEYEELLERITAATRRHAASAPHWRPLVDALASAVGESPASGTDLPDREQLAQQLRRLDATLVAYFAGLDTLWAFVLDAEALHLVELGPRRQIERAATTLHELLRNRESPVGAVRKAAHELAARMLWPVAPHIARARIVVVPDGELHGTPFGLLPWSAEPEGALLVQRAEIAVAPSAAFIGLTEARLGTRRGATGIELIGDPVFRLADWERECLNGQPGRAAALAGALPAPVPWTESLPSLPGTAAEVDAIAALAAVRPGVRVRHHLRCEATASAVRAAAREPLAVLHIATHGRVDAQRPRLSALALTPEVRTAQVSSSFELLDVLDLRLDAGLVMLSACDTSRGRLLPGEGVLGPAQAFLQSGAMSVVASLWRVEDEWTTRFVRSFYRYLLQERLPVAAALRRAQLDELTDGRSFNWAAFSVYGWPATRL